METLLVNRLSIGVGKVATGDNCIGTGDVKERICVKSTRRSYLQKRDCRSNFLSLR